MRPLFIVLLALAACGPAKVDPLPFAPAGPSAAPDPTKPGPFPVGVRTVTYEDTGRRKPDGTPRILKTEIWYPATQATRGKDGTSYDITEYFTDEQRVQIGDAVPLLVTPAVRDAPVAKAHGPFPLVIFSHGQAAVRYQSTFYTVLLASHGFVVVSTDHEGGTLYDVVRGSLQNTAAGIETRPGDVMYLLNRLSRLKEDDPLFGTLDLDRIGVTGHSFGAVTSLRVAVLDPRVKAIVPQAPTSTEVAWLALPGPPTLEIPVEIQAAGDDHTLEWDTNAALAWSAVHHPRWLLDILHGGHFTFSDLCALDLASIADKVKIDIPGANIKKTLSDGCGPTSPPAVVAQPLINHFAIAFFNGQLRGSPGSLELLDQAHADALAADVAAVTADP